MVPISRSFAAAGLAALAACSGPRFAEGLSPYQRTAGTWVGAPAAELQDAWGAGRRTRGPGGGAHQLVYSHSEVVAGLEVGCEARFTVSPRGTITRARVTGTAGGCRQLLADAPPRGR